MKVTYRATKRFLQRVLKKEHCTREEFYRMKRELEKMFASVIPGSYTRPLALPDFKGYAVVHQGDTVITILEKDHRYKLSQKRWNQHFNKDILLDKICPQTTP